MKSRDNMLWAAIYRLGQEFTDRPVLRSIWTTGGAVMLLLIGVVPSMPWRLAGGAIVTVLVGLPAIVAAAWERQRRRDVDLIELRGRVLSRSLASMLRSLATRMGAHKTTRTDHLQSLSEKMVHELFGIYGQDSNVRCSVYKLTSDKNQMRPIASYGRDDWPRPFNRSDGRGRKAIEWLISTNPGPRFAPDTDSTDGEEWEGTSEHYKTFISVAIRADKKAYGMLTIDTPQVGALTESDSHLLQAFAGALAIAFAEADR